MEEHDGESSGALGWFHLRLGHGSKGYELSVVSGSDPSGPPLELMQFLYGIAFKQKSSELIGAETSRSAWILVGPHRRTGFLSVARVVAGHSEDAQDLRGTPNVEFLAVKVPEDQAPPTGLIRTAERLFSRSVRLEPHAVSRMLREPCAPIPPPQDPAFRQLIEVAVEAAVSGSPDGAAQPSGPSSMEPVDALEWMWSSCPPGLRANLVAVLGFRPLRELAGLDAFLKPRVWVDFSASGQAEGGAFRVPARVRDFVDVVMFLRSDGTRTQQLDIVQSLGARLQSGVNPREDWWWRLFSVAVRADSVNMSTTYLAWAIRLRQEQAGPWTGETRLHLQAELTRVIPGCPEFQEVGDALAEVPVEREQSAVQDSETPTRRNPRIRFPRKPIAWEFPSMKKIERLLPMLLISLVLAFQVRGWLDDRKSTAREESRDSMMREALERLDQNNALNSARLDDLVLALLPPANEDPPRVEPGAAGTNGSEETGGGGTVPTETPAGGSSGVPPEARGVAPLEEAPEPGQESKQARPTRPRTPADAISQLASQSCEDAGRLLQLIYEGADKAPFDGNPASLVLCYRHLADSTAKGPSTEPHKKFCEGLKRSSSRQTFLELFGAFTTACPRKEP